jgi:hypothetical protein
MAISSYVGAEINSANSTFQSWLSKTNEIIGDMGTVVVTIGGDNTGNVSINGVLSANTLSADNLEGVSNSAITIGSDLVITGANTTVSSNNFIVSGDIDFNGASKTLTISTLTTNVESSNVAFTGSVDIDTLLISGDSLTVPTGNTSVRPSPSNVGMLRYNTEVDGFEGYSGVEWFEFATTSDLTALSNTVLIDISDSYYDKSEADARYVNVTGDTMTGDLNAPNFNSTSDLRIKENVITVDNALAKVLKLRGVYYNRLGEESQEVGFIAQEIENIIPEVVREDESGMKTVAYGNVVGVLVEAIKELKDEIEELKKTTK